MLNRRLAVIALVAVLGCQRLGDVAGDGDETGSDDGPITACDGSLTQTPTVLFEGSTSADVIVDGDTLVLVEPGQNGWLRRLDRCSGEQLRAIPVPFLARAIVHEGAVVLTGVSEGPNPYLERWDEAANELVFLTEGRFARLYSHASELYLADREEILRFDEPDSLTLIHTIETPDIPGLIISHVGASAAGFYYRTEYDCGCTPSLARWSIGATDSVGVEGSAGARRLAALGDRIFINIDQDPSGFGSGVHDIVELPAEGGEPIVLYSGTLEDGSVNDIAANEEWVCWTSQTAPARCVNRADPGELRELASEGIASEIALAEDAVYWFVDDELLGAALYQAI